MAGKMQVVATGHIAYLDKKPKQESRASRPNPSSFCEATPLKAPQPSQTASVFKAHWPMGDSYWNHNIIWPNSSAPKNIIEDIP